MPLTQTLALLRGNVRRQCDIEGTDALARFPDVEVNDYVNRGVAALYRILVRSRGDQRFLSSTSITTVAGTSGYSLNAAFMTLISVEGTVDGRPIWFEAYQPEEHAFLADADSGWGSAPIYYAIRGGTTIDFLPTPQAVYSLTAWYVPAPTALSSDSDTIDTIARLDDYVIWWASREVAAKQGAADREAAMTAKLAVLEPEIEALARRRDHNSPPRMIDDDLHDRYGRLVPWGRR